MPNIKGTPNSSAAATRIAEELTTCFLPSNVELERPSADSDRALCAHSSPGAHSAPPQLSRPLQAFVRNPPHRKPLCACGYSAARGFAGGTGLSAPALKRRDLGPWRYGHLAASAAYPSPCWCAPPPPSKKYCNERSRRLSTRTVDRYRSRWPHAPGMPIEGTGI